MIDSKEFNVSLTVRLHTNVIFGDIERTSPITKEDALEAFYGYGLGALLDSGEYGYDVSDIEISETT